MQSCHCDGLALAKYISMITLEFIMNQDIEDNISYTLMIHSEKRQINAEIKLMCTYNDKKCVCHIRLKQQDLAHGLVLRKVHALVKFNQSRWLNRILVQTHIFYLI